MRGRRAPLPYRALLRALPDRFRERHGEAMEEAFDAALDDARRRGPSAVAKLWARETWDLTITGLRLRRRCRDGRRTTMDGAERGGAREGLTGWRDDLRYAAGSLTRNPGYAIFAWVTLSLGIGATTATFSAVESLILDPLPLDGADRMVMLWRPLEGGAMLTPRLEQIDAWRDETDVFEAVEPVAAGDFTLTGRGAARAVEYGKVRPTVLERIGARTIRGRLFTEREARGPGDRVIVLGYALWKSMFGGDPDVVGAPVTLDGETWTVIGIMARGTIFPNPYRPRVEAWAPLTEEETNGGHLTVGWLAPGVTPEEADRRMERIRDAAVEEGDRAFQWEGRAVGAAEQVAGPTRDVLPVLMATVLLLLLIACANVANLLLSRSHLRKHETAVRRAVGATRGRLVRQLLLESVLLAAASAAGGVALAFGVIRVLPALRPERLEALDLVSLDGTVLALALALSTVAGLLFGVAPAWSGSRTDRDLDTLRAGDRGDGRGGPGRRRSRLFLVAAEVALSFALLVGTTLVTGSLIQLQRQEPGFVTDGLVTVANFELPGWKYTDGPSRRAALERLTDRIARLDGVAQVTRASGLPPKAGINIGRAPQAEGGEPLQQTIFFGPHVEPDYFEVLGMDLLSGRSFTRTEVEEGIRAYVLGRTTARRFFGDEDPVGRRFRTGGDEWGTVVGVVEDVRMTGLSSASEDMQLYAPLNMEWGFGDFGIRVRPGADPGAVALSVRRALLAEEPDLKVGSVRPTSALMAGTLARERFVTLLLSVFAGTALMLSMVGLYGVVSQVVGQRTREIGIRVSLGAGGGDIRRLILGGGAGATLVGLAAGAALAYLGLRLLKSELFGLGDPDPLAFATSAVILTAVATLATWLPARRATRIDPVEALRAD